MTQATVTKRWLMTTVVPSKRMLLLNKVGLELVDNRLSLGSWVGQPKMTTSWSRSLPKDPSSRVRWFSRLSDIPCLSWRRVSPLYVCSPTWLSLFSPLSCLGGRNKMRKRESGRTNWSRQKTATLKRVFWVGSVTRKASHSPPLERSLKRKKSISSSCGTVNWTRTLRTFTSFKRWSRWKRFKRSDCKTTLRMCRQS